MRLFTLFLLTGLLYSPLVSIDEPTGHPLGSSIAPVVNFGHLKHPLLKIRRMHAGVDFEAEEGTPVYATANGTVKVVKESTGYYGTYIRIEHENGFETVYAHLDDIGVRLGQEVIKGGQIGITGTTGQGLSHDKPHLHYEIRKDRKPLNPVEYLP